MIIPKPIDNTINSRTTSGINNNHHVTCMLVVPVIKNTAHTITNKTKLIMNGIKLDKDAEIG